MSSSAPADRVLRFDIYELDTRARELRKRGVKQRLQGQPVQVLAALLKRRGDLVTREELRAEIWPADTFVDFDHSLHNAIARIREALGDSAEAPRFIETLPRRGYRFIAHVEKVREGPTLDTKPLESGSHLRGTKAIAVLPLENFSGDAGEDYFADGMTEALITGLAKIKSLRVISRTSAMQYKKAKKPLPQIARELRVEVVIEGSVMRSAERVRIALQLIQAESDQHIWAESYERDFRDILALQSEIAARVADEVRIALTPEDRARLGETRQVNPQAHELFLKARYQWNKRTEENVRKALSYFQSGIDLDPTYAEGYVGLADCYNILGYYNAMSPSEAYPKGRAAALRALQLDGALGEAHASLGAVNRDFEWDWKAAEKEFDRALELNHNCAEAYHWRGTLFSLQGRHVEALKDKEKALTIDPLSVVVRTDLGRMFYYAGDYERALEHYRAALEMDASFSIAHLGVAQVYEQNRYYEQAIEELRTAVQLSARSTFALARLAHGYALAGQLDEARAILKELYASSKQKYVSCYDVAVIHLALHDIHESFMWLQRAIEERSPWLGYIKVEPQLDTLRSEPRFQKLLETMKLA
jgi:TolB-like protein/Flp pilus assembly protein TadD